MGRQRQPHQLLDSSKQETNKSSTMDARLRTPILKK